MYGEMLEGLWQMMAAQARKPVFYFSSGVARFFDCGGGGAATSDHSNRNYANLKKKSHSCPKFLLFGSTIYNFLAQKIFFLFKMFVLLLGVGAPLPLTPHSN